MLHVELRAGGLITCNGREIALGQTHALLDAVEAARSVSGAAESLGISYRTALTRIGALHDAFGRALVLTTRGHGSRLSEAGLQLRGLFGAVLQDLSAPLAEAEGALARALLGFAAAPRPKLRVALSHDPCLLAVLAGMAAEVEVSTTGSAEAVSRLLAGAVDLAGFHLGGDPAGAAGAASLLSQVLADPAIAVRPLLRREQGLMLAAGNPLGIRSVAEIASSGARVVNRQRGSGTRIWFDRLLGEAGLSPGSIRGYETEEFTHQAVAAVIRSGAADCGMGVRSEAERFGLTFLPLGRETYYLATRASAVDDPWLDGLVASVAPCLDTRPGYGPPEPGPPELGPPASGPDGSAGPALSAAGPR